jgi:hypothetical protein
MEIGIDHSDNPYITTKARSEIPLVQKGQAWFSRIWVSITCIQWQRVLKYLLSVLYNEKEDIKRNEKQLTQKKHEGCPQKFKYTRNFPYQDHRQEAASHLHSHHWWYLVILVKQTKVTIHHKCKECVHRAYVIRHVIIVKYNATQGHK